MKKQRELTPIDELVDLQALGRGGRGPTPSQIRAALPRGWALADDGRNAYRDARLFFREAWILILGLVIFGTLGLGFLWGALPHGWAGILRLLGMIALVLVAGGIVGPLITRALNRR